MWCKIERIWGTTKKKINAIKILVNNYKNEVLCVENIYMMCMSNKSIMYIYFQQRYVVTVYK